MSGVDYAILGIVALSAVIGAWRGFVRETVSLVTWVAAFIMAYIGAQGGAGRFLDQWISSPLLQWIAAFVLLFLSVHVAGFIVSQLLSKLIKPIGLKGVDRVAGAGFGMVRGAIIVGVIVLLIGHTPFAEEPFWKQSYMILVIEDGIAWIQHNYPLSAVQNSLANAGQ